jgi:hypothetical protein
VGMGQADPIVHLLALGAEVRLGHTEPSSRERRGGQSGGSWGRPPRAR